MLMDSKPTTTHTNNNNIPTTRLLRIDDARDPLSTVVKFYSKQRELLVIYSIYCENPELSTSTSIC